MAWLEPKWHMFPNPWTNKNPLKQLKSFEIKVGPLLVDKCDRGHPAKKIVVPSLGTTPECAIK
jgi:hypothetical protein